MLIFSLLVISSICTVESAWSSEPDWSETATITPNAAPAGRENIYNWPADIFAEKIKKGQEHALHYPVSVTGMLMPARSALKILDAKPGEPLFELMRIALSLSPEFKDFNGFWDWLGLNPATEAGNATEKYPMGVSIIERNGAKGFSLSCAACHSSELFGKTILGMSNRFSRANELFILGKKAVGAVPQSVFALTTGASREEKNLYHDLQIRVQSVGLKKPAALGLDSSLAQVALSLAHRKPDAWSTRTMRDAKKPRDNLLDHIVADSKPAVWWNAKYKTRWLSDGSVVSGNPVFTNFLWNEIGRGVDLPELVAWLEQNKTIVEELTTAVFASKPPKYKDFFGENSIDITRAKRGEIIFNQKCNHCHGEYQKNWAVSSDTVKVIYFSKTPVKNVGTDAGRSLGMRALAEGLNPLEFSQKFKIKIIEQTGYVPNPLEGIWARYPYLHNNSVPNLCALMTEPSLRPRLYYSGKAIDRDRDYDQDCLGYPLGDKTPPEWKSNPEHAYDTTRDGMHNTGHYKGIFDNYDENQKADLREFLKTL